MKKPAPLTPLEALIVDTFKGKGGVFAIDEDGDLHAVLGQKRCGLYCPTTSAAPFLVFGERVMERADVRVILRALVKAARNEKAAGTLRRLRLYDAAPHSVLWEDA